MGAICSAVDVIAHVMHYAVLHPAGSTDSYLADTLDAGAVFNRPAEDVADVCNTPAEGKEQRRDKADRHAPINDVQRREVVQSTVIICCPFLFACLACKTARIAPEARPALPC